jgi:outer membrane protein assembly factor BamB
VIRFFKTLAVLAAAAVVGACGGGAHATSAPQLAPVRWRWRPPPGASVGMPAADANDVVATFSQTFVVDLKPDGSERWRGRRLGLREEAPLLTPGLVVVPAEDALVAFDRRTGDVRWDTRLGQSTVHVPNIDDAASTPVAAGNTVFTCRGGGELVAVEAGSGAVRWRMPLGGRCDGPPATDGQTVVASWDPEHGEGAGIGAFDVTTGAPRWSAPLTAGAVSAPAITGPVAVVVDFDLAAKAFDLSSGRRLWTTTVGGGGAPKVPPLPVGNDKVLAADRVGGLTMLDLHGHKVWSLRVRAAVVQDGPAGPTADGQYAVPLYNGKLLVAAAGRSSSVEAPGGLANGVAVRPGGGLLVSTAQGRDDQLVAYGPP